LEIQLCEFCLKSGMLCNKCQAKVDSGEVDQLYIDVAKTMLEMEPRFPSLEKVRLDKVLESGAYLVLLVGRGQASRISSDQRLTKELGDRFGKRVLVLENGVKDRQFLEQLFANQHILTINIIWLPDGSTETRVVLQGRGARRLSKKRIQSLVNIAKAVRNMDLRVEYSY